MSNPSLNYKDILFIWIPKTAGTSMYNIFERYDCQRLIFPREYMKFENGGFVSFTHFNIFSLLRQSIMSQEFFNKAFKFAFVRNPWDRLVSLYFYRIKKYEPRFHTFENYVYYMEKRFNSKNGLLAKVLNEAYERFFHRFKRFHKNNRFFHFNKNIEPIGLYNVMGMNQANPQADWIVDQNGQIIVDYLGRFENLVEDFNNLCDIIGISEKLPQLRTSQHRDYRTYYNDKTKRIVEEIYKKDIEIFNYEF